MIEDTRAAVDALSNLEEIDSSRIFLLGYAMGAKIGLLTAGFEDRVKGLVSICGVDPLRLDTPEKGTEGIRQYSHLHGLLPRLGFFVGHEPTSVLTSMKCWHWSRLGRHSWLPPRSTATLGLQMCSARSKHRRRFLLCSVIRKPCNSKRRWTLTALPIARRRALSTGLPTNNGACLLRPLPPNPFPKA